MYKYAIIHVIWIVENGFICLTHVNIYLTLVEEDCKMTRLKVMIIKITINNEFSSLDNCLNENLPQNY